MSDAIEPVVLETERLRLRPFEAKDVDRLCELAGAEEVYRTTLNIPHPYLRADAEAWIIKVTEMRADGTAATFGVTLKGADELIGAVGLTIRREHDRAELGFWMGVPYWNMGYTTEAARAVLGYGFDSLRLERIFAGHISGNDASGRVQQKIGLQREGVLRHHFKKAGAYVDDVVYAMTREQWVARQAQVGPGEVRTERLVLRPVRADDVDAMMAINSDERVAAGVLSVAHPYTRRDAIGHLTKLLASNASGAANTWMIMMDGEAVGTCGFDVNERHLGGMMGYTIRPDLWGKGLATEAVGAMLRYGFEMRDPPMHRLYADHFPENAASGRVCEKAGMVREGVQRGAILKDGAYRDLVRWATVRDDWLKERG